jgi:hypothetical protein
MLGDPSFCHVLKVLFDASKIVCLEEFLGDEHSWMDDDVSCPCQYMLADFDLPYENGQIPEYAQRSLLELKENGYHILLFSSTKIYDPLIWHQVEWGQTRDDEQLTDDYAFESLLAYERWMDESLSSGYTAVRFPMVIGVGLGGLVTQMCKMQRVPDSYSVNDILQFYILDDFPADVQHIVGSNEKSINLVSQPILLFDIIESCFSDKFVSDKLQPTKNAMQVRTRLAHILPTKASTTDAQGFITCRNQVILYIKALSNMYTYGLTAGLSSPTVIVSSDVFHPSWSSKSCAIMKLLSCKDMCYRFPQDMKWSYCTSHDMIKASNDSPLNIDMIDGIFNNKPDANVFASPREFISHFKKVIDYASKIKSRFLFFSDESAKLIKFHTSHPPSWDRNVSTQTRLFIDVFKTVIVYAMSKNVMLIMDHTSPIVCNFMASYEELMTVSRRLDPFPILPVLDVWKTIEASQDAQHFEHVPDCIVLRADHDICQQLEVASRAGGSKNIVLLKGPCPTLHDFVRCMIHVLGSTGLNQS